MSDAYQIDGVTVTPTGGGWYEISHSSLSEPEKAQGKETADARAQELANSLKSGTDQGATDQGAMQGQPPLDTALANQQSADADKLAKLKAQLAETQGALAEEQAARLESDTRANAAEQELQVKTVKTDGGAVPPPPASKVPAGVPRKFDGVLDDKAKAELKRLGIETTRIVLEENETIPPTGLFLGHNGRGYVIVPGEEVDVPNFLLGVLNDAVMSSPVVDSKTQKVLGYRNRMRYPYRKV